MCKGRNFSAFRAFLFVLVLLWPLRACAGPGKDDIITGFASMMMYPSTLGLASAQYYDSLQQWPTSAEELKGFLLHLAGNEKADFFGYLSVLRLGGKRIKFSEKAYSRAVDAFFAALDFSLVVRDDGGLLIEGGFTGKMNTLPGSSDARYSFVGYRTEDGFAFIPSEGARAEEGGYLEIEFNLPDKKEQ